jgi:hypothetical protein
MKKAVKRTSFEIRYILKKKRIRSKRAKVERVNTVTKKEIHSGKVLLLLVKE